MTRYIRYSIGTFGFYKLRGRKKHCVEKHTSQFTSFARAYSPSQINEIWCVFAGVKGVLFIGIKNSHVCMFACMRACFIYAKLWYLNSIISADAFFFSFHSQSTFSLTFFVLCSTLSLCLNHFCSLLRAFYFPKDSFFCNKFFYVLTSMKWKTSLWQLSYLLPLNAQQCAPYFIQNFCCNILFRVYPSIYGG